MIYQRFFQVNILFCSRFIANILYHIPTDSCKSHLRGYYNTVFFSTNALRSRVTVAAFYLFAWMARGRSEQAETKLVHYKKLYQHPQTICATQPTDDTLFDVTYVLNICCILYCKTTT